MILCHTDILPIMLRLILPGTDGDGNLLPAEGNKFRDVWKQVPYVPSHFEDDYF
jgi:hypothetical protein